MLKISHDERNSAAIISDDLVCTVREATTALADLWERHFSNATPQPISTEDYHAIERTLSKTVTDLENALVNFELLTGQDTEGVRQYLLNAFEYANFLRVTQLNDLAVTAETALTGEAREKFAKKRAEACQLEDSEAALERLKTLLDVKDGATV